MPSKLVSGVLTKRFEREKEMYSKNDVAEPGPSIFFCTFNKCRLAEWKPKGPINGT